MGRRAGRGAAAGGRAAHNGHSAAQRTLSRPSGLLFALRSALAGQRSLVANGAPLFALLHLARPQRIRDCCITTGRLFQPGLSFAPAAPGRPSEQLSSSARKQRKRSRRTPGSSSRGSSWQACALDELLLCDANATLTQRTPARTANLAVMCRPRGCAGRGLTRAQCQWQRVRALRGGPRACRSSKPSAPPPPLPTTSP